MLASVGSYHIMAVTSAAIGSPVTAFRLSRFLVANRGINAVCLGPSTVVPVVHEKL